MVRDNQKKIIPYWDLVEALAGFSSGQRFFLSEAANEDEQEKQLNPTKISTYLFDKVDFKISNFSSLLN